MMQKKQRGMTMISWVIILALVAIQGVAAIRIVPIYLNFSSVKEIMESIKLDPAARGATPTQLLIMVNKRLSINGLYDLLKKPQAFTYQKNKTGMSILLNYEERGPIYGNLEFVATFEYEIDIPAK